MIDPLEEVEPAEPIDAWQALTVQLHRSMLWDMIGPYNMRDKPELYGQNPASLDVLEAEANEMWDRKKSLTFFGMDFPMLCYMAAESASLALTKSDESLDNMSESEKLKFRASNVRLGTAVAETVISHMLQRGLIKYGDNHEFLGQ